MWQQCFGHLELSLMLLIVDSTLQIFFEFFFFFLLLCPLGQNIIPIWNESKWNTIMQMIAIPTAKFMFVGQWGGALKRQKIKLLYITRKRKKSQHSSTNRLYIHTQVVVSLTLCPNQCFFSFLQRSSAHKKVTWDTTANDSVVGQLSFEFPYMLCTGHTSLSDEKVFSIYFMYSILQ